MRILNVISIKTYERYGYNPNDFEELNILHIQGKLDYLPQQDKVNLHNAFNKGMENRKWTEDDKRRSEDFIE
ncbi:hypothetical protein Tco_0760294, partial [Tanacetum coccineum]